MIAPQYSLRRRRHGAMHASDADADLRATIAPVQRDCPRNGYRRVAREPRARSNRATHKRVQRVMQAMLLPLRPAVDHGSSRSQMRCPVRGIPISGPASSRPARISSG